jgi:hypothetical protein
MELKTLSLRGAIRLSLLCKEVTPELVESWEDLVYNSPQGTIFHSEDWLNSIKESYQLALKRWIVFDANDKPIGGAYVFIRKRGGLTLAYAPSSNAATPYGGLLVIPPASSHTRKQEAQYKEVISLIQEKLLTLGANGIFLTMSPSLVDVRSFQWKGWHTKLLYTYLVDLRPENLFARLDSTARNTIRKAEKQIVIKEEQDLIGFYELYQNTYHRKGKAAPVPKQFLEDVFHRLGERNQVRLFMAYNEEGRPAAGAVLLSDQKRSYYWLAASDGELARTGAPTLLLWKLFEVSRGLVPEIDLVGANTEPIAFFKAVFNPTLQPYYSVEYTDGIYQAAQWLRQGFAKVRS